MRRPCVGAKHHGVDERTRGITGFGNGLGATVRRKRRELVHAQVLSCVQMPCAVSGRCCIEAIAAAGRTEWQHVQREEVSARVQHRREHAEVQVAV